jgi:(E)-4-hydroxy-3-methylbut-2-enyl-diphosphate synthase
MSYCASRYLTIRRRTIEVKAGAVGIGGDNPIRIQSMTTSDTQDVVATVRQCIALAEAGCEIIRVTAPNVTAAKCLRDIRAQFSAAGFARIPLVADIHFLPAAAMEAIEHVEKVRVNPGNYAGKKKFALKDCTDADYDRELRRIHDAFTPLVLRAKTLGRSLRIGVNHGSLSDRIMNRHGDTPAGMVESALEFLRVARDHAFDQIVLSMKASNPKVMIQACRLLAERMQQEAMRHPLHLGVTEAGDGEDGRIKGAIGIGSLLQDGLGDTIRVSLTEDSIHEIPVARALAAKAQTLWQIPNPESQISKPKTDSIDPFHFTRRDIAPLMLTLAPDAEIATGQPPRVITRAPSVAALPETLAKLSPSASASPLPPVFPSLPADTPAEAILIPIANAADLALLPRNKTLVLDLAPTITAADLTTTAPAPRIFLRTFTANDISALRAFAALAATQNSPLAIATTAADLAALAPTFASLASLEKTARIIFTLADAPRAEPPAHPTSGYRQLAETLRALAPSPFARAPIWIRNTPATTLASSDIPKSKIQNPKSPAVPADAADATFLSRLLDASILTGSLLCDGIGDIVSVETEPDPVRATKLAYNILQGAGARISKTEFVACPSCGRTLFDLQATTQRIREKTGHLKGVKLAIMGCIVNGPGEMADADFGYVGGAPGKINLYVGKKCVRYNIPQAEADDRLIDLLKQHGKWVDPA